MSKDYFSGAAGNPFAAGSGQLGYMDYQASQKRLSNLYKTSPSIPARASKGAVTTTPTFSHSMSGGRYTGGGHNGTTHRPPFWLALLYPFGFWGEFIERCNKWILPASDWSIASRIYGFRWLVAMLPIFLVGASLTWGVLLFLSIEVTNLKLFLGAGLIPVFFWSVYFALSLLAFAAKSTICFGYAYIIFSALTYFTASS